MNCDDVQIPLTLPDTQNAENLLLTQSQDVYKSQPTSSPWGQLYPAKLGFPMFLLNRDLYSVGRKDSCDIFISEEQVKKKIWNVISKVHFTISREPLNCSSENCVIYLQDLSHNGTFVNNERVGRGNKVVLENDDVISLAKPELRVYVFKNFTAADGNGLPPELRSKYVVSHLLGTGACGQVKLIFRKVGCKRFAMKTIVKKSFTSHGASKSMNDPDKIMNEVRILKALRHPNIIRMEDIIDTPTTVYIVLELMEGGELFDRIRSSSGLSEKCGKLIFYQVVLAVEYLHRRGITHRDLKPENILLANNAEMPLVKVSDFGLSKFVDAETMMRTFCGTPMYVAPEVLMTHGRGFYTSQVDVWSLGVILYVCLSGYVPFSSQNIEIPLHDQIIRGMYKFPHDIFANVSARAIDLIKRMLIVNPKKRITIKQVLLHSWLQDPEIRNMADSLRNTQNDENAMPVYNETTLMPSSSNDYIFGAPDPVEQQQRFKRTRMM